MGGKAGVRGQKATGNVAVREGYRLAAKIEIEIFTPDRPVRREGVFDAATDGPAHRDTRGRASRAVDREPRSIAAERRHVRAGRRGTHLAIGETAGRVKQNVVGGKDTKATAQCAEPV